MSLRLNYEVKLQDVCENRLRFSLVDSDLYIDIYVLDNNMMRVYFNNDNDKKSFMLSPGESDINYSGTSFSDLNFSKNTSFNIEEKDQFIELSTQLLKAEINLLDFHITWYFKKDNTWQLLANDRYTQAYNFEGELGQTQKHYLTRYPDEKYYGLGEKTGDFERSNRRFKMLSVDPMGYDPEFTDPLYKMIPFYITKKEDYNFGIFYDCISKSTFDMGKEYDNYHGKFRYFESIEQDLDYYIFANDTLEETVKQFTYMTGKPVFTPKWSLSYSGSTMTYTDADNAQEQLNEFVDLCKEHDVACGSFQLSSGYTSIGDKRYVFNWNDEKFPNVNEFSKHFKNNGLELCANIKPALLISHPMFKYCEENGLFIKNSEGSTELSMFWDELGAYLDFTNIDTFNWWKMQVKKQLLEKGIMNTWNDNNEYEIWSETALCNGFGNEINFENTRAIQPLLMMKASYEAQQEFTPNKRPYVISRSGCSGMQKYVQTWTGDNITSFKSLKYNIKTGLGLSMSGIYNIGHDVGGFSGDAPNGELFVRWVQNGIFHPRFTIHSWNDDHSVNTVWMYPQHTKRIVNLLNFRESLLPYLYNLVYNASYNYEPIIRPTLYQFEQDVKTQDENDDFMLGSDLLICNVVNEGELMREVYLPDNQLGWYEFKTNKYYEPAQNVVVDYTLDDINFFVQAGSLLYTNQAQHGFNKNEQKRKITIYPSYGELKKDFSFYEDDGESIVSEDSHLFIEGEVSFNESEVNVTIRKNGKYTPEFTEIEFELIGEQKLVINGKEQNIIKMEEL